MHWIQQHNAHISIVQDAKKGFHSQYFRKAFGKLSGSSEKILEIVTRLTGESWKALGKLWGDSQIVRRVSADFQETLSRIKKLMRL